MNPGGFAIRRARPQDAAEIVAMSVSSWRAAHRDLLPARLLNATDPAREEAGITRSLAQDDVNGFVAEEAGRIIGFAMLRPYLDEPEGVGEISTFYVATEHWRRRIGSVLCKAVLDIANERHMASVVLWVLEGNERAMAFFADCGFARDGERKNDKGPPDERLTKFRMRCRPQKPSD